MKAQLGDHSDTYRPHGKIYNRQKCLRHPRSPQNHSRQVSKLNSFLFFPFPPPPFFLAIATYSDT